MKEEFSGTESENTADTAEFSQDEFGNVDVERLKKMIRKLRFIQIANFFPEN